MIRWWLVTIIAAEELPRSGWAVIGTLIITVPATLSAIGTLIMVIRQNRIAEQASKSATAAKEQASQTGQVVAEIKSQVVNGHEDPLRTDLDKVRAGQAVQDEKLDAQGKKLDELIVSVATLTGVVSGLTHRVDMIGPKS